MAKYIDADKAVEALLELYYHVGFFEKDTAAESIGVIKGIPAADVVEVVRCKDCENYQTDWQPLSFVDGHYCAMVDTTMPYDGFCYMGERRKDG